MSDKRYKNIGDPEDLVIEECSEVIKIICKAKRFGWFSHNPYDPMKVNNIELAKREMDDVIEAFEKLGLKLKRMVE